MLAAFSRLPSRCYQLSYRHSVLGLFCTDETSSAQWTTCFPSLHLQTLRGEDARRGRCAGGDHAYSHALLLPGHHRAPVIGTITTQLSFLRSILLPDIKHDATDRFMRDTVLLCNRTKCFVVLHHPMHDHRPVLIGNTVFRVFWPWSPLANYRRRTGVMCFTVSEQLLDLEIQCARRSKEEIENW